MADVVCERSLEGAVAGLEVEGEVLCGVADDEAVILAARREVGSGGVQGAAEYRL